MTYGPPRIPLEQRFWLKVNKAGDCWIWTAAVTCKGYGKIGAPGRGSGWLPAHRVSYELHFGPIPEGLFVMHQCDNPPCVNPAHLTLGTCADNVADMGEKKRARCSKLTHCSRGHPFSTENTYRQRGGKRRVCKTCSKIWYRARRAKYHGA